MMRREAACVMLAVAAMVLAGCANLEDVALTPCGDEPGWVSRGSGKFGQVEERQIIGVGSAFDSEEADAAELAKKNAREELAGQLKSWVEAANSRMSLELAKHFKEGEKAASSFFRRATREVPSAAAESGEVRSRWTCEVTDEAYCLMAITEARAAAYYRKHVAEMAEKQQDMLKIKPEKLTTLVRKKGLTAVGPVGDLTR